MDAQVMAKIPCAFLKMPDPRKKNPRVRFNSLLTIALLAVICRADDWVSIDAYANYILQVKDNQPTLDGKLKVGMPSHARPQVFQGHNAELLAPTLHSALGASRSASNSVRVMFLRDSSTVRMVLSNFL